MEKYILVYIVFYLVFMSFIVFIVANSSSIDTAFDLTEDQKTVLDNPSNDAITILNKFAVLSSLNSSYTLLGALSILLSITFGICVALVINEFIPFT